jgi:glycosyltransferase involved in cell wall biosynthesis
MPKIYNLADVLLLTSEKEGSPMVILEALACGIPIVVTPSGGVSELVRDGDNGLVLGSTSPHEIAATVVRCLNRTWDHSALASSVQNWSSTVVGERLVNLFVTVWKDSRRRNVGETVARRTGGGLKEQNAGIKERVTEA